MTEIDADLGRDFEGLDAREAQEALAEELADEQENEETKSVTEEKDTAEGQGAEVEEEAKQEATSEETKEEEAKPKKAKKKKAKAKAVPKIKEEDDPETFNGHLRMAEALVFAASEPLDKQSIEDRLPVDADVPALMERLTEEYAERGINLKKVDGNWRFVTAVDVAHVLEKEKVQQRRLSRAALETLAIIAYHQPCTRADIEDVRGVTVAKGSLDQLLEIGWVRMRGKRMESPGRPTLYGTTQSFLDHFTIESIEDLPGLADLKAAGLLDARLPPGFSVPSPVDGHEDEELEEGEETEFAQDFLEENDEIEEIADA